MLNIGSYADGVEFLRLNGVVLSANQGEFLAGMYKLLDGEVKHDSPGGIFLLALARCFAVENEQNGK